MDAQMAEPGFWDNNDRAQKHIAKLNGLKRAVLPVVGVSRLAEAVRRIGEDAWK